jgi:hypothetical protein
VDYSDYLAWCIPFNKAQFDSWVIVTASHDERTRRLCDFHHLQYAVTDDFYRDDAAFNKAAGINVGIGQCKRDGWLVHMDADIVLPPRARELLEKADLLADHIYGIDRMMCKSFDDWTKFVCDPKPQHEAEVFVHTTAFEFGVRIAKTDADGYVPIGFFQLWNPGKSGRIWYPEGHKACSRADMQFAQAWPRKQRALIPEIVAIHLESEVVPNGHNWRGRRSGPFCGYNRQ